MHTHQQLQNEQRQIALWKVALWSLVPFMVLLFFATGVYHTISTVEHNKLRSILNPKDTILRQLTDELNRYENQKTELIALLKSWQAVDAFIGDQKQKFLRYGPHQREQLDTEILLNEGEYEALQRQMVRLDINDTLLVELRKMISVYAAIGWSQARHEALSPGEELRLARQQLSDKDKEIRELMLKLMSGAKTEESRSATLTSKEALVDNKPEIVRLNREIEDLRRQAIEHDKEQKKECHKSQIEAHQQFRDKLKELLNEKRKLDSIVPEIKALIKELNQSITQMKANKV